MENRKTSTVVKWMMQVYCCKSSQKGVEKKKVVCAETVIA